MPYRSRRYYRKKLLGRLRAGKGYRWYRNRLARAGMRNTKNGIYSFQRVAQIGDVTSSTVDVFGAFSFQLDDIPNYTEFAALYDQYKITGIKLMFIPDQTVSDSTGSVLTTANFIHVVDFDDETVPTSTNQLFEYQNVKINNFNRTVIRYFKPSMATGIYNGSAIVTGGNRKAGWIDTSVVTIPHYGFKYAMTASTASRLQTFRVYAKFYIKCKNVR